MADRARAKLQSDLNQIADDKQRAFAELGRAVFEGERDSRELAGKYAAHFRFIEGCEQAEAHVVAQLELLRD